MTLKDQSSNLVWFWNNKPIKLKDMHYRQLNAVKKLLLRNNNNWYGHNRDSWLNAIRTIEKPLDKKATDEAINLIIDNRIKNAELQANSICNMIIKANINNNERYKG